MINDRTAHLSLPLPHVDNLLIEDVERQRQAWNAVDARFLALDALLQSDDATLDAVQELVNAIKQNRADIMDLLTEQEEVQTLVDGQTEVVLAELGGTSGCAVFIDGIRLNKNEWTPDPVLTDRFTLTKTYPAGYVVTVVRRQGGV